MAARPHDTARETFAMRFGNSSILSLRPSAALVLAGFAASACGDTTTSPTVGGDASTHEDAGRPKTHDSGADTGKHDAKPTVDAGARDARSDADTATEDAAGDVGVDAPKSHGDASSVYPAYTADVPGVQDQGGPTLATPQIVTITWPNEPNAAALESFGDDIGTSSYWAATTSEYGVGPAVSGALNHVRLTEQPIAEWTDVALQTWIQGHAASYATYGLPAPNRNVIYTMYLSTATDLSVSGTDGCQQGIGGYHSSFVLDGIDIAYAVILQCGGANLKSATRDASHELIEASTDPHPDDIAAYYGFDSAHLAWDVFQSFQDEVADACEFYYGPTGSFFTETFSIVAQADGGTAPDGSVDGGPFLDGGLVLDAGTTTYSVQRSWSNASAAAGHAPCVPAVAGPYYSVTPLDMVNISLDLAPIGGGSSAQTLGYHIAKGETASIPLGFHSDAATTGPWTISASEGNPLLGGVQTSHLTMSIDTPTGQNGDIAYLTVTVNAVDTSMNGELVTITSQLGSGTRTYLPLLISNE